MGVPIHCGLPPDHPDAIRLREIQQEISEMTNLHLYLSKEELANLNMISWHIRITDLQKEYQNIIDKYLMQAAPRSMLLAHRR